MTAAPDRARRPNILMIMTDQEMSAATLPKGMLDKLPGHLELMSLGTSIDGYHVQTTPCSPSRSTIVTGRHTQTTGVYSNNDTPPNPRLADIPTLGHMLRAADYYTVYKGKWHLSGINEERDWPGVPGKPSFAYPNTTDCMERFGFSDYGFNGEEVGLTWAGYHSDRVVAGDAARLILDFEDPGRSDGKPWFMVVGLVNPHDIMFFDATGEQTRSRPIPDLIGPLRPEPGDPLYAEDLGFDLPESFYKDDLSTKPEAHMGIRENNDFFFGKMPMDDLASWRRFTNYYYNCLRDVDRRLTQLIWALRRSGQLDNTIIVYTSDHGERAAAHGLRQKAGTIYREETNVPMIIAHPDVKGGGASSRLMSAIDLAPTLMAFAGKDAAWRKTRFPDLPGIDVSGLLADPLGPTERDERGHLFDYAVAYMWGRLPRGVKPAGPLPYDLTKRRLHRGVHDGRYKFARYFAPAEHHRPEDWETLAAHNDLELYDVEADPHEIVNLAADPAQKDNILRLNGMVNRLIDIEVGADDGREFPGDPAIYQLA
ncbi:sulfatase-like hydrolase/transferase [Phenylobacterium sp.]|uniref:sulfatase-like hydrolase/transferase n=1 Tax=Phenylobacterium sp. TaxID=1871053 RepID=UPI0035B46717